MKVLVSFLLCICFACEAEINWVSTTWWPAGVPEPTKQLIERRVKTMPEIKRHEIDMTLGKAVFYWKPNSKYSDHVIRSILAWSGITGYGSRIKVRGVIQIKEKQLYLVSLGDGTEFPLYSQHNDNIPRPVLQQYELEPLMKARLETAATKCELVTMEGPLFMSLRPPVGILVEQVAFDD